MKSKDNHKLFLGTRATMEETGQLEEILLEWRHKALYWVTLVVAVVGLPVYLSMFITSERSQVTPLFCVFLTGYAVLVGIGLSSNLDYRLRGGSLLLLAYVNALASFARAGLVGSGRIYLVIIPLVATMVIGARTGYISAALSLIAYVAVAVLAHYGLLESTLTVQINPRSLTFWGEAGAALAMFLVTLMVLFQRSFGLQARTLMTAQRASAELGQTAKTLEERQERFNLVIQGANDGIWDWDLSSDEVYFSARWKSMLGYEDREIPNRIEEWRSRIHPEDRQRAMDEIEAYLDGKRPFYQLEHRLRHKDGTYRHVLARGMALLDQYGQPHRMVGAHTDITELKRAEESLRRRNDQLTALHRVSMDLTSTLELEGVLQRVAETSRVLANSAHAHIFLFDVEGDELTLGAGSWDPKATVVPLKPRRQGTTYTVARTANAEFIEDAAAHPAFAGLAEEDRPGALVCLPLMKGVTVLGTLNLGYWSATRFDAEMRSFLQLMANQAAIAIDNAQLYAAAQRRANELVALHEIDLDISAQLDLQALLSSIVRRGQQLLGASGGDVYFYDPKRNLIELAAQSGLKPELVGTTLEMGEGLSGRVAESLQPMAVDDYHSWEGRAESYADTPVGAAATVPLLWQGRLLGTMGLQVKAGDPRTFREGDLQLMEKLAAQASIAIQNARLFEEQIRQADLLRRRVHELAIVNEISERVTTLNLDTVQRSALDHVVKTFRAVRSVIGLYDCQLQSVTITAVEPADDPALGVVFNVVDDPLLAEAMRLKDPVVWRDDLAIDIPGNEMHAYFRQRGITLLLIAPLVVGEDTIGFLVVDPGQREPEQTQIKLLDTIANQVATAIENARLFDNQQCLYQELALAYDSTLEGWSRALDLRDRETEGHTQRVAEMTIRLARAMSVREVDLVNMRRGALLHDIGKMGIPDAILHKPGPLSDEEWAIMRKHPLYAYDMLSPIEYLRLAIEIPYCHHEKWDGSGYPRGLQGQQIPMAARIFAAVDVWDALCSDRPYRAAWPVPKVQEHIRSLAGTHFDPQVVDNFLRLENGG